MFGCRCSVYVETKFVRNDWMTSVPRKWLEKTHANNHEENCKLHSTWLLPFIFLSNYFIRSHFLFHVIATHIHSLLTPYDVRCQIIIIRYPPQNYNVIHSIKWLAANVMNPSIIFWRKWCFRFESVREWIFHAWIS